jgi:hypothetical protein
MSISPCCSALQGRVAPVESRKVNLSVGMVLSSPRGHMPLVMHSKSKEATEVASVYGKIRCNTIGSARYDYSGHPVMQRQGECARINSYAGMRAMVTYDGVAVRQRDRMLSRVRRVRVSGVGIPRPWTQVPTLPYTTLP